VSSPVCEQCASPLLSRHSRLCADCRKKRDYARNAAWQRSHPEAVRAYSRKYDKKRQRPGGNAEYQRRYYQQNKESIVKRKARRYQQKQESG